MCGHFVLHAASVYVRSLLFDSVLSDLKSGGLTERGIYSVKMKVNFSRVKKKPLSNR